MSESIEARLCEVEARIKKLEERYADVLAKMESLNATAFKAVEKISRAAEAAESMRDATRTLLAQKEAHMSYRKKH